MAKQRSYHPVRIDIPSLSGGVGRASPAKRMPTESQDMDNMIASLEHSAEKRKGVELLDYTSAGKITGRLEGISDAIADVAAVAKDVWWHWFNVSIDAKYLIAVDYKATSIENLMWIFKIDQNGQVTTQTWGGALDESDNSYEQHLAYMTYGNTLYEAKDALRAVAVGSSLLIVNTKVKAGFTSDPDSLSNLRGFDGETTADGDVIGRKIKYLTSTTVDPKGIAEVWTKYSQYVAGDTAYDTLDRKSADPLDDDYDENTYDYLRYGIWRVLDDVTLAGPDESGYPQRTPSTQIHKNHLNIDNALSSQLKSSHYNKSAWTGASETSKATCDVVIMDAHADHASTNSDLLADIGQGGSGNSWFHASYTTSHDSRHGHPYYLTNRSYTKDNYAANDSFKKVKIWYDTTEKYRIGAGFDQVGFSNQGCTTICWDPSLTEDGEDTSGNIIYADFNDAKINNTDVFLRIYVGTESGNNHKNLVEVRDLVEHTCKAFNWWADNGALQFTATPNAAVNGWEQESIYFGEQWERDTNEDDENRYTDYIEVSDYFYPNPDQRFLGQAISALSDLKFPPDSSDLTAFNGGSIVENTIIKLYPDFCVDGPDDDDLIDGHGKLFYLSQPYLGLSPGYFRVKSITEQPYLHKIRTPHEMSVLDRRRMPRQLVLEDTSFAYEGETKDAGWWLRSVTWDPRDSGDIDSNPGPTLFHDSDGNALQREIKAMSFYRGRLFLASDDILVSSRLNDWDNFFLADPTTLTVADPIDLSVSSNAYTPITYLQPFRNFLFLATDGSTQYELLGSENQISPLTAEIAPTSFYNMTLDVSPIVLNNNLFFLDKNKMYIYFGEQSDSPQNAIEVSVNAPEYLPSSYKDITTNSMLHSIFILDKTVTNHVYCYTNRVSGEDIAQNAFYRFTFPSNWIIESIEGIDEYLYVVYKEEITDGDDEGTWTSYNIGRVHLRNENLEIPRVDSLLKRVKPTHFHSHADYDDPIYDATAKTTTFYCQSPTEEIDTVIFWDDTIGSNGVRGDSVPVVVSANSNVQAEGCMKFVITSEEGTDYRNHINSADGFYLGKKYTSTVELSPQFLRDENYAVQNGMLNLRNGMFRFVNSGDFSVSIQRKNRTAQVVSSTINLVSQRLASLSYAPYKEFGVFKVPVLGFSNDLVIKLESNSVHPVTISDVEFTGKFKYKMTSLGTR